MDSKRRKKLKNNKIDMKKFYDAFSYPFGFLPGGNENYKDDYTYDNICMTMFNKNMKAEKIDMSNVLLPRDIKKVYWYREGKNDEDDWLMIGEITVKNKTKYIFYKAGCDYTGFDCQGNMRLYVSRNLNKLLNIALTSNEREMIYKDLGFQ